MSDVKGSKQYRSVVVREEPGRRPKQVGLGILLLVVATLSAYWLGGQQLREGFGQLSVERDELVATLAQTEQQLQEVTQQLTNTKIGAEVDRGAVDEVRTTIREQKEQINALTEEISFYKGLMAPTERERGLGVRSWEVFTGTDSQRLQFKLVLQQLALKHAVLTGSVSVVLVAKQLNTEGVQQEQRYHLSTLSEQVSDQKIKLRFKYFQSIEGELILPEDFTPERVEIIAKAVKPKSAKVEKIYVWTVQGDSES